MLFVTRLPLTADGSLPSAVDLTGLPAHAIARERRRPVHADQVRVFDAHTPWPTYNPQLPTEMTTLAGSGGGSFSPWKNA